MGGGGPLAAAAAAGRRVPFKKFPLYLTPRKGGVLAAYPSPPYKRKCDGGRAYSSFPLFLLPPA